MTDAERLSGQTLESVYVALTRDEVANLCKRQTVPMHESVLSLLEQLQTPNFGARRMRSWPMWWSGFGRLAWTLVEGCGAVPIWTQRFSRPSVFTTLTCMTAGATAEFIRGAFARDVRSVVSGVEIPANQQSRLSPI